MLQLTTGSFLEPFTDIFSAFVVVLTANLITIDDSFIIEFIEG
jgi:hypothetical protein